MLKWISKTIRTNRDAENMRALFYTVPPTIGAFDTETTGLHIIEDKPFLFQFGWYNEDAGTGYTFAVDLERKPALARQVIKAWNGMAKSLVKYYAHNVKFDMHMLTNIGLPYLEDNLSDTMFLIRLGHDAIPERHGGPPLKLKQYATRFITRQAASHEKNLDFQKQIMARELNVKLMHRLGKGWTKKKLDVFFKDKIMDASDLPEHERQAYSDWLSLDVPLQMRNRIVGSVESEDIPYNMLDRETVISYAHYDIVLVLELHRKVYPVVEARGNLRALKLEEDVIMPLYEMERVGFSVDKQYLIDASHNMKTYILQRRAHFADVLGNNLKTGQHEAIRDILVNKYALDIESTNDDTLSRIKSDLQHDDPNNPAIDAIATLQELRTLEKWYAVYLIRFLIMLRRSERLYTTINQVGTVSGRVTSDFQQFPKEAIQTVDGVELFQPRRMVQVSGGDYHAIVYIDYSQIELRLQAMYTILVGHPEPNLCRAYMPYNCVDSKGKLFDPGNPADVCNWEGEWYLAEDTTKRWEPIDVHAATTCLAFDITPDDPHFKKLRSKGKRINFAKNYGAQFAAIKRLFPEYTDEQISKINDSYYLAFPGVKAYHDYCYKLAMAQSYATNLFGVRYYNVSGHNLINMLVQGSGAYFLKWKMRQLYDYGKANNIKSRFQMNIHDELSWEKHIMDSDAVFFKFKEIMETWEDSLVPIVAEPEITYSNWASKKEYVRENT